MIPHIMLALRLRVICQKKEVCQSTEQNELHVSLWNKDVYMVEQEFT